MRVLSGKTCLRFEQRERETKMEEEYDETQLDELEIEGKKEN